MAKQVEHVAAIPSNQFILLKLSLGKETKTSTSRDSSNSNHGNHNGSATVFTGLFFDDRRNDKTHLTYSELLFTT
jgi:hypothetical protein